MIKVDVFPIVVWNTVSQLLASVTVTSLIPLHRSIAVAVVAGVLPDPQGFLWVAIDDHEAEVGARHLVLAAAGAGIFTPVAAAVAAALTPEAQRARVLASVFFLVGSWSSGMGVLFHATGSSKAGAAATGSWYC